MVELIIEKKIGSHVFAPHYVKRRHALMSETLGGLG